VAEKKNAKGKTNVDLAGLQFSLEGDPFWAADLNDAGHTVALYGKTREQVEQRAAELLASRQADAKAVQQGEAWAPVAEGRDKDHVTD
jgi:hypothetical protein